MSAVLGQQPVQQRFMQLLHEQRMPHAWLLHGMKGIGKALLAADLAANYLCQALSVDDQACGDCHSCKMLKAGSHPDLIAVDILWDEKKKKFNRDINVAQVRDLLSFIALSGSQSQRRVVILDDADMMNMQAANALLKGLEEPTSGSLLLMVCHNLNHLPATVRSRCMLEHCRPLNDSEMQQALDNMDLHGEIRDLALALSQGCPGEVAALQDKDLAKSCLQWYGHVKDLERADIGALHHDITQYVKLISHDLMLAILMLPLEAILQRYEACFEKKQAMLDAASQLLAWPAEVQKHSLRPAPVLLSRILDMRAALKQ
ncbi:MAG: DNA polymerase III subunit delta' [Mariprofundaceae bacterium]